MRRIPRSIRRRNRLRVIVLIVVTTICATALYIATDNVAGSKGQKPLNIQSARMSDEISVHAAGQGNPWINLSDGHELITPYTGPAELTQTLERNQAWPLSLCSADFDEDGVPDLVSGYAGPSGGIVTILRGNVDSLYPIAPEAQQRSAKGSLTDAPFLSPAFVFGVPEAADFIGAGDFDGDGHWDVVAAARGSDKLCLMSGDGKGGLRETKRVNLPGGVTAMVVGEINRRDGLDDVVVGISGGKGSKVLVFEGPEGALRANPEIFDLPAEATSLALGQLDDSYEMDLAIAAGQELIVVRGRDRELLLDARKQQQVRPASISRRSLPYEIRSVAVGDFTSSHGTDITLLSANGTLHSLSLTGAGARLSKRHDDVAARELSSAQTQLVSARAISHDVVVIDPKSNQLRILASGNEYGRASNARRETPLNGVASLAVEGKPAAVLPMRLNADGPSDLVVLRSDRSAPSVVLTAAQTTFVVTNTNDGGPGSLRQAILDANSSAGADQITFSISGLGVHTISPASPLPTITDTSIIDGTTQPGFADKPIIELSGLALPPMTFRNGLEINAGNCVVKGLVINGFVEGSGIFIVGAVSQGNRVEGCYIGFNPSGTAPVTNNRGIAIGDDGFTPNSGAKNNVIGGTSAAARNIISGNKDYGVVLGAESTTSNRVEGNFIGTNPSGSTAIPNLFAGVGIFAPNNTVGGTEPGARNVISGSVDYGILISSDGSNASGNLIQGNYIGPNADGSAELALTNNKPDVGGVALALGARANLIGGTTANAANVISGNADAIGVIIEDAGTSANQILGNLIGTDATGTRALGNGEEGVLITQAPGNIIGGNVPGAGNIISANNRNGIAIGLRIVDLTGRAIAGETGATVQGNSIGTDINGRALGNGLCGILVDADSFINTIDGNLIAFNGTNGVCLPDNDNPAVKIAILNNAIHSNAQLGIDLGPPGPTPNPGNLLTGANNLQNFPDIDSAVFLPAATEVRLQAAISIQIRGSLSASANTTYNIQFFFGGDCSSGQGHQFTGSIPVPIGTADVSTNASGIGPYDVTLNFSLPSGMTGGFINATATDRVGNTSEQSLCQRVSGAPQAAGPTITGACKGEGKQLIIAGSGFADGGKVLINGNVEKKTLFVSSTQVIAFKAGKRTFAGDLLKVRNPVGAETSELTYTQMACPP